MRTGRPLKFATPEILQEKIDQYFKETPPIEVTISGLALFLDTSRETLMNYEKKDDFFDTVKKAKLRVQVEYEKDLRKKARPGDIFALKNFGWSDRQEITGADGKDLPTPIIPINVHTNNSNKEDNSVVEED
jgi:hypothetical protein